MNDFEFTHRRQNPLTGDWVLVSPHRNNRPWLGATEESSVDDLAEHEATCPLCPGNARVNNEYNPDYQNTFVFVNDFGALLTESAKGQDFEPNDPLFKANFANGECRVVCFSPKHNKSLPELSITEINAVVDTWQSNYVALASKYSCVHVFENKGAVMGCSQPHPHGQIWAHDHLSTEILLENTNQLSYQKQYGSNLLNDYVNREIDEQSRVVIENAHWLVVVPFWAAWPFETMLVAKDDIRHFGQLNQEQKSSLSFALQALTICYDNIFNCSFPYSMGWHSAPSNLDDDSHWRLHAHFYPPLLRSESVKKHMVGYEMLAESQRDLSAETAAKILRSTAPTHYKHGK